MEILHDDVSYSLLRLYEPIRGPYNETVYADDYLLNKAKGYWYRLDLQGGMLLRQNQPQAKKLNARLAQLVRASG